MSSLNFLQGEHDTLHSTNFRGTMEPKKFGKSTSKEHTKGNWYKRTSGFLGFLRKQIKKSFKVLSTGLQYLVCGCTMITVLFVPKFWKRDSSYCKNLQIFPEVDLDYRHVNVEKFTGRALFHEKYTSKKTIRDRSRFCS
jgi:hypothetical protein